MQNQLGVVNVSLFRLLLAERLASYVSTTKTLCYVTVQ